MYEYCYLYDKKEVYCIGDVIRVRRKMMGLSPSQLCDGICSIKTLRRLETHAAKTQRTVVEKMMTRLKLPSDCFHSELVTDNLQAKKKMRELRRCTNEHKAEEIEDLIKEIGSLISMEIPFNRQVMMRYRVLNEKEKGQVSFQKIVCEMKNILEITISLDMALSDGAKYMTNEELLCLQNLIIFSDKGEKIAEQCVNMLSVFYKQYEEEELVGAYIDMYNPIMDVIASYKGNNGYYDESDTINRRIIKENVLERRMTIIHASLYSLWWNYNQRKKESIPFCEKRNTLNELENCIVWSKIIKDQHDTDFFELKKKMLDVE
jgi:hypothetical protein